SEQGAARASGRGFRNGWCGRVGGVGSTLAAAPDTRRKPFADIRAQSRALFAAFGTMIWLLGSTKENGATQAPLRHCDSRRSDREARSASAGRRRIRILDDELRAFK